MTPRRPGPGLRTRYQSRLRQTTRAAARLSASLPPEAFGAALAGASGLHAHFATRAVDAVTLRPLGGAEPARAAGAKRASPGVDEGALLAGLERTWRSLNNLETELHHGFFA